MMLLVLCGAARVCLATVYVTLVVVRPTVAFSLMLPFALLVLAVTVYDIVGLRRREVAK